MTVAIVARMTIGNRPDIQQRMAAAKVALVIIPRDKAMTDLPEFASLAGTRTFDGRPWESMRGAGGVGTGVCVPCGVVPRGVRLNPSSPPVEGRAASLSCDVV